jgi:hypothetical protein
MQAKEIRYYSVAGSGDSEVETWDSVVRPVVDSEEFANDFQCMSGGIFLDKSGRKVLWEIIDGQTKSQFGGKGVVINSVFVYQDSDGDSGNCAENIYRTSSGGNDILPLTLPPGITRVKAIGEDGEVLCTADFVSHSDCYRYALIVESGSSSPKIPVDVHEMSEKPHASFLKDILTVRSFARTAYAPLFSMDGGSPRDARSGVLLGWSLAPVNFI